jgi:hypothetical protein
MNLGVCGLTGAMEVLLKLEILGWGITNGRRRRSGLLFILISMVYGSNKKYSICSILGTAQNLSLLFLKGTILVLAQNFMSLAHILHMLTSFWFGVIHHVDDLQIPISAIQPEDALVCFRKRQTAAPKKSILDLLDPSEVRVTRIRFLTFLLRL